MSDVTLRGAVRLKTGVAEFGFSRDDEGNGVLSWASVPAGRWSYDVFMDDGNEERPLLYGCFVSAGRVTPDLPDEQQAVAGAVVVQLPEGSGCVQVMLDNASSAAWYAEQAKKYATNAGNSEVSAANSAAAAASSATDAAASAASAASSSSDAAHSAANAASSEAKAASSEANAMSSATAAAASASNASMSEANAASSQSSAAASASDAASSSASASTSAHNAAASESSAESYAAAASKSASDAATSATSAANSATEAQQVLEAIPQVDASGNMTLAGNITAAGGTFDAVVNANGGINIPLAVGAVTDTSAVNRLYAAGMAGVTGILTSNAFLNTDAITASGSSTVTKTVPYHLAGIKVPKGTHSTIQARFEVSNPQWNYSSFAGFSFLWRATNAAKLSFGIGRGGKTIRPDLSIDSYSIIPANGLAYNHGEILDITFDNVRNTDRNGYTVRVREIFALNNTDSWQVKTTTSFVPASQNEPVPWTIAKIIYQQKSFASIARYEDTGALWLMLTGGQRNNLYQIATCRGVSNFETGVGVSQWVTDVVNNAAGDVSVYAGTGEYTYYHPGNVNPVFYGLDAISRNCIESEETADFVDINIPL